MYGLFRRPTAPTLPFTCRTSALPPAALRRGYTTFPCVGRGTAGSLGKAQFTLGKAKKPTVLHRKIDAVQLCTPFGQRKNRRFHGFSTKTEGCCTPLGLFYVSNSWQVFERDNLLIRQNKRLCNVAQPWYHKTNWVKISTSRALKIIHRLLSSCQNWQNRSVGRKFTHRPRKNQDFVLEKLPSFEPFHPVPCHVHWAMGDRLHAYCSDAADQILFTIFFEMNIEVSRQLRC